MEERELAKLLSDSVRIKKKHWEQKKADCDKHQVETGQVPSTKQALIKEILEEVLPAMQTKEFLKTSIAMLDVDHNGRVSKQEWMRGACGIMHPCKDGEGKWQPQKDWKGTLVS